MDGLDFVTDSVIFSPISLAFFYMLNKLFFKQTVVFVFVFFQYLFTEDFLIQKPTIARGRATIRGVQLSQL